MGIREYFEKHPEKDLKLHDFDLDIEKEGEELRFDPETEILDSDWQKMLKRLNEYRKNKWRGFAWQAMCMKIFYPERVAELGIDDQAWQGMKQILENIRTEKYIQWGGLCFASYAYENSFS